MWLKYNEKSKKYAKFWLTWVPKPRIINTYTNKQGAQMKANEIQVYKNIGTIQLSKNEDGEKCYLYTHFFDGKTYEEDTIKGAREMLDWNEKRSQEIKAAIQVLNRAGYKIYKEVN